MTAQNTNSRSFFAGILDWLTKGYPEGVPPQDRFPLIALLRPRLTDDQVEWVADKLVANDDRSIARTEAQMLITKVTRETPSAADLERVRRHLVGAGATTSWDAPRDSDA